MRSRLLALVLALPAALLAALAPQAVAQLDKLKDTTPAERARVQTEVMTSSFGLRSDQTSKVAAINRKYADQMEPIIKGSEGSLRKMRAARDVETAKEAELKQVLSPDQFQKFLASKEAMREKFEQTILRGRK
jgi:hypothetical protein